MNTTTTAMEPDIEQPGMMMMMMKTTPEVEANPTQEEEEDAARKILVRNRARVSVLRYMLGFPKTSLTFFLFIMCFVLPISRPYESVQQPMQDLGLLVQHEAARANESYFEQYATQIINMTQTAVAAKQQLQAERTYNQDLVEKAKVLEQKTWEQLKYSRRLLQQVWLLENTTTAFVRNDTCSAAEVRDLMRRVYGNQEEAFNVKGAVLKALEQFVQTSRATIRHVTDYTKDRTQYDYDYFIGLKMVPALNLIQSISAPELDFSVYQMDLLLKLEVLIQDLLGPFNEFYVRLDMYKAHINGLSVSVTNFHLYALDLYARLQMSADWVKDFLPNGAPLPKFLNLKGLALPDSFLPEMDLPSFSTPLPNMTAVKLDFSNRVLVIIADFLQEVARKASEETQEAIRIALEALKELLTLEDYHPPQYESLQGGSLDDVNDQLEKDGRNVLEESRKALLGIFASLEYERDKVPRPDLSLEDGLEDEDFSDDDESLFDWMAVEFPTISLPFLARLVAFLISWQLLVDAIIQFIRFWRLQKKWEDWAVPKLPDVNLASTPSPGPEEEKKPSAMSQNGRALMENCTFGTWIFLVLGLLFLVALAIYVPTVKSQCIDSQEGTFMARKFLGPNYVNEANRKGSARAGVLRANIRKEKRNLCEYIYDNGKRYEKMLYEAHQAAVDAHTALLLDAQYERQLMQRCVDVAQLDEHMTSTCCGLEGHYDFDYKTEQSNQICAADQQKGDCPMDAQSDPLSPFRTLSHYLGHPVFDQFDANQWTLAETDIDYCDVLDDLGKLELDAIDEELILDLSIEAFCKTEVWFIQVLVGGAVLIVFALIMHLKCDLFFDGTKRVYWRQLSAESTVKCYADVREDGSFSVNVNMYERAERIRAALKSYEFIGKCKLRLAAFLLVFEIILACLLKHFLRKWFGEYV